MMVTDNDLEKLKEIGFKLGAYELAAKEHKDLPIGMVKESIDRAWDSSFGKEDDE